MIILTTLCIIGYCFVLTRFTRWAIETTPLFVISALISVMYVFSYFDYLHVGATLLIGLGLGCLLLSPLYIRSKQLYARYLTPSFTLLFLFALLFAVVAEQSHLYLWDEFTQWGAHAKFISATERLWMSSTEVVHPTYPPGAALFYYLFYPFSHYTEGAAYFAQQLLILLPLGILLKDTGWLHWKRVFLTLTFATLILMVLSLPIMFRY